jgi:hypothetical protein
VPGTTLLVLDLRSASSTPLSIELLVLWLTLGGLVELGALVVVVPVAPGVVVAGVEVVFAAVPVLVPGVVVGLVVPGVVGVVLVGAVAVVGVVGTVAIGAATAGVVTVVVVAGTGDEPPARLTRAAASTPRASTATTTNAPIGRFQLGAGAKRVRAAAPQLKHHDCSGCSGAPHTGQASPFVAREGVSTGVPPGGAPACGDCGVVVLTSPIRAG